MTHSSPRLVRTAAVLAALALAAAACGDDDEGVAIDGAWARTSPMSAQAGAAYFEISSEESDVLIGASVDASVAGKVEIHETSMVSMGEDAMDDADHGGDDSAMDDTAMEDDAMDDGAMDDGEMGAMEGMGDVMQMREIGRIELPAGDTVVLEPGGLHIMLLDLAEPLEMGSSFELTLDFETAEDLVVTVEVRDGAPE